MDDHRITSLPEAILGHILSFLPTKEVVATSVLSKQWMSLWRSVPTLDFDENRYVCTKFVQSVNAVIDSRDLHQSIQTFSLRCWHIRDPVPISAWVNAAVQRRVQHLDLNFTYLSSHRINLWSIFSCKTIMVLRLQCIYLYKFSFVDLPFLKVQHLKRIYFSQFESLVELLSGCPNLQDLNVRKLFFVNDVTHREFKTLPKLVRANISTDYTRLLFEKVVSNVEFLQLKLDAIYNPHKLYNLNETEMTQGMHMHNYIYPLFHNLIHVELVYCHWYHVGKLLNHCPKLQVLVINQKPRVPTIGFWQAPELVPECIQLHLKRCNLNGYRDTEAEFSFASYIMQNSRFLKEMTISNNIHEYQKFERLKKLSSCKRLSTSCKLSFQ